MKEKKWLLLFALVLIGVLGNCGKSYAADEVIPYSDEYLTERLTNEFVATSEDAGFQERAELCRGKAEADGNGIPRTFYAISEAKGSEISNSLIFNCSYFPVDKLVEKCGQEVYCFLCLDVSELYSYSFFRPFYAYVDAKDNLQIAQITSSVGKDLDFYRCFANYNSSTKTWSVGKDLDDEGESACNFIASGYLSHGTVDDVDVGLVRLETNMPIFKRGDTAGIRAYCEDADLSGAMNADQIMPEPETSYTNKNLYLKNIQYSGVYLTSKPISNAYGEWSYFPVYDGYDIGDCSIEFFYNWDGGFTLLDQPSEGFQISESSTNEVPLETFRNSMRLSPYAIISTMCYEYVFPLNTWIPDCSFGGSFTGVDSGVNFNGFKFDTSDILKTGSSILKVSFRLKAKDGNNYNYGRMYTYTIDLLTGETEEYLSSVDEDGNYTNKEQYKVYDTDGNVTVKTDATSGGSSSSSDNSFTVQDGAIQINVNPTFNVEGGAGGNGGDGGDGGNGGNGGWSFDFGSSGDNDGDGEDDGDGIHGISIKEFLALITGGIGLLGSNGLVSMLAETFSFVPEEFWRVVIFGMVAMIVVAIMRKF